MVVALSTRPSSLRKMTSIGSGQSGIQTYYDPYRIRKVLKRAGPRGSNKWKTIPFEKFVDEVVGGGALFGELGDDRHYPGFDEVWAIRDPALAKAMVTNISARRGVLRHRLPWSQGVGPLRWPVWVPATLMSLRFMTVLRLWS